MKRVVTIGIYGHTEDSFVNALLSAEIDFFCDLRARRGLRGSTYAFGNARRLQAILESARIAYRHYPELSPRPEVRALQHQADLSTSTAKRQREELSPAFVDAYVRDLAQPAAQEALQQIRDSASAPALFCVERTPTACHRSLVASFLAGGRVQIQNISPCAS